MNSIKELKLELKKLNGLQWTKTRLLREFVKSKAKIDKTLKTTNGVRDKFTVFEYSYLNKKISKLSKDLNRRKREIHYIQSQIDQIRLFRSKDAYFIDSAGWIIGIHSVGFAAGPNEEYVQQDIWMNSYKEESDGSLAMVGGSNRVFSEFDEVVEEHKLDPNWQEYALKK